MRLDQEIFYQRHGLECGQKAVRFDERVLSDKRLRGDAGLATLKQPASRVSESLREVVQRRGFDLRRDMHDQEAAASAS